jgi:hypothetical protein
LSELKKEVSSMELRIGIVSQSLLQSKLKASQVNAQAKVGAAVGGAAAAAAAGGDDDDD